MESYKHYVIAIYETLKLADMLQSWLDKQPTPVTWSKVISALESKIAGKNETTLEILHF